LNCGERYEDLGAPSWLNSSVGRAVGNSWGRRKIHKNVGVGLAMKTIKLTTGTN